MLGSLLSLIGNHTPDQVTEDDGLFPRKEIGKKAAIKDSLLVFLSSLPERGLSGGSGTAPEGSDPYR
jgi:hypothetical protein